METMTNKHHRDAVLCDAESSLHPFLAGSKSFERLEANHSNHGIERVHGIDTRTAFGLIVETGYPKPCTNV